MRIPEGYVDRICGTLRIVALLPWREEMTALLGGPERESEAHASLAGRGGTRRVRVREKTLYLRHYLRGGLVRHVTKDLYLWRPPRPLRELAVTCVAYSAGCRVPKVIAVCMQSFGPLYKGWIVTQEIENSRGWYVEYRRAQIPERRWLLQAAGRAMRALVRAGVYHVDLNATNLLLTGNGEVAVIDFDRAKLMRPDSSDRARRGRDRFWRSLVKLETQAGEVQPDAERTWLERGYEL